MANETTANAEQPKATQKTKPQPIQSPRPLQEERDIIDWGSPLRAAGGGEVYGPAHLPCVFYFRFIARRGDWRAIVFGRLEIIAID